MPIQKTTIHPPLVSDAPSIIYQVLMNTWYMAETCSYPRYPSYSPSLFLQLQNLELGRAQTLWGCLQSQPGVWLHLAGDCVPANVWKWRWHGSCWDVSIGWKGLALSPFLLLAGWKVDVKFGAEAITLDHELGDGGLSRKGACQVLNQPWHLQLQTFRCVKNTLVTCLQFCYFGFLSLMAKPRPNDYSQVRVWAPYFVPWYLFICSCASSTQFQIQWLSQDSLISAV